MQSKTSALTIPTENDPCKRSHAERLEFLSDSSPKDVDADKHKAWAEKMAAALLAANLPKEAARVRDCAEALFFHLLSDDNGEIHFKLHSAPYCKYRHCPICQWRRSLRNKAIVMSALPAILEKHPTARFAMLTLTVRNCYLSELRQTIRDMNKGWQRLIQRKDWLALGWIRGVEVTRGQDGSAHPHFHALLMLPSSYFSGQAYIPTREWVQLWRQAMRLDYDPVCHIRMVKAKVLAETTPEGTDGRLLAVQSAVSEVAKYATKATDLLEGGPEWLAEYVEQVRSLKFLTSGGVLKGIFIDQRPEQEDLVHVGGDEEDVDGAVVDRLAFHWRTSRKRYARKRTPATK